MIDTEDRAAVDQVAYWAGKRVLRGIRLVLQTLETNPEIWEKAAQSGLNILVFEQPAIAPRADSLAAFARGHPDTRLVLSHLGMPDCGKAPDFRADERILALADNGNMFVQISGMHMFGRAPYAGLVPLITRLVECFGPERLLYGSNYPVMETEAVYGEELSLLRAGRLGVPREAANQVSAGTAKSLWFDRP